MGCYVVISFFWSIFQNFWNDVIPSISRLVAIFGFWSNPGNCVFPKVALFLLQHSRLARCSFRDTPCCATPYYSLHPPPAALENVPKLSHIPLLTPKCKMDYTLLLQQNQEFWILYFKLYILRSSTKRVLYGATHHHSARTILHKLTYHPKFTWLNISPIKEWSPSLFAKANRDDRICNTFTIFYGTSKTVPYNCSEYTNL